MTPEIAVMTEIWDKVRSYIPAKDRLSVAEEIVRVFDENVDISGAEHELNELDTILKAAVITYYDIGLDDEDEFGEYD